MEELALFSIAFAAATILPFSSELAFLTALETGMPKFNALLFASMGNVSAIILNYFLGYWLYEKTKDKLHSGKVGRKALAFGERYGFISLLLSWLPIFGDPLTLVAGLLRINFILFLVVAGSMRVLRYYFLATLV